MGFFVFGFHILYIRALSILNFEYYTNRSGLNRSPFTTVSIYQCNESCYEFSITTNSCFTGLAMSVLNRHLKSKFIYEHDNKDEYQYENYSIRLVIHSFNRSIPSIINAGTMRKSKGIDDN